MACAQRALGCVPAHRRSTRRGEQRRPFVPLHSGQLLNAGGTWRAMGRGVDPERGHARAGGRGSANLSHPPTVPAATLAIAPCAGAHTAASLPNASLPAASLPATLTPTGCASTSSTAIPAAASVRAVGHPPCGGPHPPCGGPHPGICWWMLGDAPAVQRSWQGRQHSRIIALVPCCAAPAAVMPRSQHARDQEDSGLAATFPTAAIAATLCTSTGHLLPLHEWAGAG